MPQQITEQTVTGNTLFHWTIQEYEQHEKNRAWYVIMGIIGTVLIGYGVFTDNYLFALIIILFAIIMYIQSHQQSPQVPFYVTELGIAVGTRFYTYSELDSFYIIYEPPAVKSLFFEHKKAYQPRIQIPILDEDPLVIREALLEFLPENLEQEEEPFSDRIAREWRFH